MPPPVSSAVITLPVGPTGTRCQLAPPAWVAYSALTVRTMEVHGGCAHGAVPSTQPCAALMKLVEYALNPDGTGPPDGPTGTTGEPVVG